MKPLFFLAVGLLSVSLAVPQASAFTWLSRIQMEAQALSSAHVKERLEAVKALRTYDIVWTQSYLLKALYDTDTSVQMAAAEVLAEHREKAAIPTFIDWLSKDLRSKRAAAYFLGRMQAKDGVEALVRALGDSDTKVRTACLEALGNIGGPTVVMPIVALLNDRQGLVRQTAIAQLTRLKDRRAVIPLLRYLHDPNLQVRLDSIKAMGVLGDTRASKGLLRELHTASKEIREEVIIALGKMGAKDALAPLLGLFKQTKSRALRNVLLFSIAQIAKKTPTYPPVHLALVLLIESLQNPNKASTEAIRLVGAPMVPFLLEILEDKRLGDRTLAVSLLGEIGDARATTILVQELSRTRVQRKPLLQALAKLHDPKAVRPMLALLDDPSEGLRLQTMQSLEPLLGLQSMVSDVLVKRLQDPSLEIRLLAARYLGRLKARSSVEALLQALTLAQNTELQAHILLALGRLGDARAMPPLLSWL